MDLGARYYQLSRLGGETFLESVPSAFLLRLRDSPNIARGTGSRPALGQEINPLAPATMQLDTNEPAEDTIDEDDSPLRWLAHGDILPLFKRPNTPFIDLITLGRSASNDIRVDDPSVSRFQTLFRYRESRWQIYDGGSRNGTFVDGVRLPPRTEKRLPDNTRISVGSVQLRFHLATTLFDVLNEL